MMAEAHRLLAGVCGQLSLCLVRNTGSRSKLREWARTLREVADKFDLAAGPDSR